MRGEIHLINNGTVQPTPFLDAGTVFGADLITSGLQRGIGMFAFHPDFATDSAAGEGKFYTVTSLATTTGIPDFTSDFVTNTHHSVLSEWSVDANNPDIIDPNSRREILRIEQPNGDHNMGQLAFNPNVQPNDPDYGNLYIAMGDGGGYNANQGQEIDPQRAPQNTLSPYGSILRIDPLQSGPDKYTVPGDNPFFNDANFIPEIWAYGFRNPHRFSWDTAGDGKMIISDIGQDNIEEVNLGQAMANYGWSDREGTFVLDHFDQTNLTPLPANDATFGFTYPVAQYDHDEGFAIVVGFVYRGSRLPQLKGQYVFGDVVNGRVFFADVDDLVNGSQAVIHELTLIRDGAETTLLELLGNDFRADLRFGIDAQGEIYLFTKRDGMIRMLVPEPGTLAVVVVGLMGALNMRRRCVK